MISTAPQHDYVILLNARYSYEGNLVRDELSHLLPPHSFLSFDIPAGSSFRYGSRGRLQSAELIREEFVRQICPDVLHIASAIEGFEEEVCSSIGLLPTSIPTAVTLYDLIPLVNQERYLSFDLAKEHYLKRVSYLQKADLLLAISEYSAQEGRRLLTDYTGDIVNIAGGIDDKFFRASNAPRNAAVLAKFGVTQPFILYTASFDLRKNQEGLIKAFAQLPQDQKNTHQVVFVGNGWPEAYQKLINTAKDVGISEDKIIFTGRTTDSELIELYRSCKLFVFPSLWEGLGLPLIEAMACGAPAIGSNTTSLPEFLAHPDASFDPFAVEDIARSISRFLQNDSDREWLRTVGMQHAQAFTWKASAEKALHALEGLVTKCSAATPIESRCDSSKPFYTALSQLNLPPDDRKAVAECVVNNEAELKAEWLTKDLQVGWVTTWASRCGIASYSKNLVSQMDRQPIILAPYANRSDLDVYPAVESCWKQGKDDDLNILLERVRALSLDHVLIQFNYGFYNFFSLKNLAEGLRESGISYSFVMHSTTDRTDAPADDQLKTVIPAIMNADAVYVHTRADVENLRALGVEINVHLLPQGVVQFSENMHVPSKPRRRIATYGFFLPGKGLPEAISAVELLNSDGIDAELLMVNACYEDEAGLSRSLISKCHELVHERGLANRVTIIDDYLEDEESLSYLRSADIILFPYQSTKESSSAAVRMGLASGRAVAVTPLEIFEDVRNVVYKLPGTSPRSIADGLASVLEDTVSGSAATKAKATSAELWRAAHSVGQIARHLEHQTHLRTYAKRNH